MDHVTLLLSALVGETVGVRDLDVDSLMVSSFAYRLMLETYTGAFVTYTSTYWTEMEPPLARMANLTRPEE